MRSSSPLRSVLEEAHHTLDRVFHAEESGQGGIELDRPVKEDAPEARVPSSVDNDRIAYGGDHSLGCARRHARIVSAAVEKFGKAHRLAPLARVGHREDAENLCASSRRRARRIRRTRLREGVRGLGFHREFHHRQLLSASSKT